jgi:ferredoxin-thioredoxin reductase catalytic subunit
MSDAEKLYETLKKIQEPKGYFFNKDRERTIDLLEALLINKERYGYMGCPCRLLSEDRERDKDIFCPCDYREPDVKIGMRRRSHTNMSQKGGRPKRFPFDSFLPVASTFFSEIIPYTACRHPAEIGAQALPVVG